MGIKLSILDQSILNEWETSTEALGHTITLAQKAEELGYHRFWVSEHHDSDKVAGSSPEVLVSYLLAKTERIRIGSGGVMLQHYSPYKVAENFNVLASLAPGRVDLGVGGAPGGLPLSTQALQQDYTSQPKSLADKIVELEQFIANTLPEDHPFHGLQASPLPVQPADIYYLGRSASSAEAAAKLGLPYVYAQFFSKDDSNPLEAFETYHKHFTAKKAAQPQAILALSVIVADTDEEAEQLAAESKTIKIYLANGKVLNVTSAEKAEEYGKRSGESYRIELSEAPILHGSKETIYQKLSELQKAYNLEEFIIVTPVRNFAKRMHSFELLKEAFSGVSIT
ncbi:LLM class flavin-dependent oxidoreductase [Aneurinibacillus uraniidurans]|uniref:LLM class flavin-dependent oxidoreductase n=1 Tax=Aneurinibacillus uraniidurans TaxID=2966586 RepID=UPI002349C442|nr:LLM class flavin-dependent oxidoreductase [Aneurinibacillus sp. B1]WCN36439.1 LLM class flavin-dependent oxidoreductase [Aneurinibacillus sp. B1]